MQAETHNEYGKRLLRITENERQSGRAKFEIKRYELTDTCPPLPSFFNKV